MDLDKLISNANALTYSGFEAAVFSYIKSNLISVLKEMQHLQLFVESTGADDTPLGFYNRKKKKRTPRAKGEPFDMVFSGKLQDSIKVTVTRTEIKFDALGKYTKKVRFEKVFLTDDWFGLTEAHMDELINQYLLAESQSIVLNKLMTGTWQA